MLWPVPDSFNHKLQRTGPGSFWENRGDRCHCGVDIYAPFGSDVVAIEPGLVVQTQLFTSPDMVPYWNETFAVTIQHESGCVIRYAEMHDLSLHVGARVHAGNVIGHVGQVLQPARITDESPRYIQELKDSDHSTMLHVEAFDRYPFDIANYLGGNTFQNQRPDCLLDPTLLFC